MSVGLILTFCLTAEDTVMIFVGQSIVHGQLNCLSELNSKPARKVTELCVVMF